MACVGEAWRYQCVAAATRHGLQWHPACCSIRYAIGTCRNCEGYQRCLWLCPCCSSARDRDARNTRRHKCPLGGCMQLTHRVVDRNSTQGVSPHAPAPHAPPREGLKACGRASSCTHGRPAPPNTCRSSRQGARRQGERNGQTYCAGWHSLPWRALFSKHVATSPCK